MSNFRHCTMSTQADNEIIVTFSIERDVERHAGFQQVLVQFEDISIRFKEISNIEIDYDQLSDANKAWIYEGIDDWYEDNKYDMRGE
jgi:hypothetical protein